MRIEVLVGNEEPRVYPLDRPKILLGSNESCDIIIDHKGISRKHLTVTTKNDKYYVSDLGSLNGSFINELRLVPGSSAEFTSFFPVRLGDDVLITLLSDEEADDLGGSISDFNSFSNTTETELKSESTKMISLNDLNKSSTTDLVQKRTKRVAKRKIATQKTDTRKKVQKSNSGMNFFIAALLAGVAYYQLIYKRNSETAVFQKADHVQEIKSAQVENISPILRVEESTLPTLPSGEKILMARNEKKCSSTDIEKQLCSALPLIFQDKWGTVMMDKSIVIFGDGAKYAEMSKSYMQDPTGVDNFGIVSLMLWMKENLPSEPVTLTGLEGHTIVLALVDATVKEDPRLVSVAYFVPDSLLRLRQKIEEDHFTRAKKNGASELAYAFDYLRFP